VDQGRPVLSGQNRQYPYTSPVTPEAPLRQPTRYQPALWAAVRTATLGFLMLTNHAFAFEVKVGTVIYPGEDRHPLKFSKANGFPEVS
jgi:hypothetical protein